jgi:hypothetical protein
VTVDDVEAGPEPLLEIDINYKSNPDSQGVPGLAGLTKFSNIKITNARVSGNSAVKVIATPENPVDGIVLKSITGTCARPWMTPPILATISNPSSAILLNYIAKVPRHPGQNRPKNTTKLPQMPRR